MWSILIRTTNEGYWNSFKMALQLKDVIDYCQVLYPEINFVFLFDHSQGHARKREEGTLDQIRCKKHVENDGKRGYHDVNVLSLYFEDTLRERFSRIGFFDPELKIKDEENKEENSRPETKHKSVKGGKNVLFKATLRTLISTTTHLCESSRLTNVAVI